MALHNVNTPAGEIFWGHLLLMLCCVFYLIWWLVAFKPGDNNFGVGTSLIIVVAGLLGLAGVVLILIGTRTIPHETGLFPGNSLLIGGVIAYILLCVITGILMKRPVTTELFLITGWVVMELSTISALYGAGVFTWNRSIIFSAVVAVAAVVSLVAYGLYYKLDPVPSYIDGTIPLVMVGIISVVMAVLAA